MKRLREWWDRLLAKLTGLKKPAQPPEEEEEP